MSNPIRQAQGRPAPQGNGLRRALRLGRSSTPALLVALAWALLACYPNPAIFFRNLARYRRLLEGRRALRAPP